MDTHSANMDTYSSDPDLYFGSELDTDYANVYAHPAQLDTGASD